MSAVAKPTPILVVEDEAIVALDLKTRLEELGYDVVGIADNADDAVALARLHRPQLVLMDVQLRGERDGVDVAAALRSELATPVVFLTSFSDPVTVRRAAETAAYGYLTKPFQIKELTAGIEVALTKARMEQQLREADRWFASTLRCVSDGVVVVELDARIRFMNPAAEALSGWTLEDSVGRRLTEVVRFDSQPGTVIPLPSDGRASAIEYGLVLMGRDGRRTVVDRSAAPVDDEQGRRQGAVFVLRDASERLRQEERLRASEERFRSAFDHAPLGMALISLDGRVLMANAALARMLQSSSDTLRGELLSQRVHPGDREHEAQRLRELIARSQSVVQFELRWPRTGGDEPLPTLVNASLLHEDGAPTCMLYQVHDLTAQKRAAEQLAELAAERMRREASETASRMKTEFLSRVSHEMRTPLNAVLGFGQLLQVRSREGKDVPPSFADHIVDAGSHLLGMVNDLLDLQAGELGSLALSMEDVASDELMASSIEMLRPAAQALAVGLRIEVPPHPPAVRADPRRLRQVLLNLGSNAIKYSRHGGTVHCTIAATSDGHVCFSVRDEGMGMTAEQQAKLFQPFDRLGREASGIAGTGLGLVIAKSLVERMDGRLSITSTPGHGTTAAFELKRVGA